MKKFIKFLTLYTLLCNLILTVPVADSTLSANADTEIQLLSDQPFPNDNNH